MLNTSEILSLEQRWKNYKIKSYLKKVFLVLFLFSAIPLGWLVYKYILTPQSPQSKSTIADKKEGLKVEINKTDDNNISKYVQKNQKLEEEVLAIKEDMKKIQKAQSVKQKNQKSTEKPYKYEEMIDQDFLEENLVVLEPYDEGMEPLEEKPKIVIQTNELKDLNNLQEKFYQTKNIIFALMLAEEYYHNKDYKNSLKWALISNELDSKSERSWIIFAKSKAKSGQEKKAIQALKAYLKTNPNAQKIKILIKKIKYGDF